jgi:hypothetical protein
MVPVAVGNAACLETDQVARAMARAWSKGSAKAIALEVDALLATSSP